MEAGHNGAASACSAGSGAGTRRSSMGPGSRRQSRHSLSSTSDSDAHNTVVSMSKRWTTLETVGRCMFLFSVAFFIVGVLITVFGFSNTGINPSQQIPLQVWLNYNLLININL